MKNCVRPVGFLKILQLESINVCTSFSWKSVPEERINVSNFHAACLLHQNMLCSLLKAQTLQKSLYTHFCVCTIKLISTCCWCVYFNVVRRSKHSSMRPAECDETCPVSVHIQACCSSRGSYVINNINNVGRIPVSCSRLTHRFTYH